MTPIQNPQTALADGRRLIVNQHPNSSQFAQGMAQLESAATAGLAEAQLTLGHVFAQIPVLENAAQHSAYWYRQAADQNHPIAQDRLADLYLLGKGVEADDALAFQWMARAAKQGHPHALCSVAYLHDNAVGTPFNPHEATRLYLLAAAQADPRGLFNTGLRYRDGLGAPQNDAWALACLSLGAFARYPLAQSCTERLQSSLSAEVLESAQTLQAQLRLRLREFQTRHDR